MGFGPLRAHGVKPIIRAIDHYKSNRNNAYMLEFRVGKGKVLVTTLGILDRFKDCIEARHLLRCLLDYTQGESFKPGAEIPADQFLELFQPRKEDTE